VNKRGTKFKNSKGITLIVLVITVIVMLILAGVSLNAIVGDNGIITNAQTANMKSGMVALEEWLQQKYVEYYDESSNYAKKPLLLNDKIRNLLLTDGGKPYIINGGKVYYLLNKTSLPKEVREQLINGNATEYGKYIRLQDVYGITEDLKVYYCDEYGNNTYGQMIVANIDPNTPIGKINNDNNLKAAISDALKNIGISIDEEKGVTIGDVENLNNLEIDGSKYNGLSSISGLGEIKGLRTLTLTNLGNSSNYFADLNGIESLPDLYFIYFKNCYISDYSKLSDCWRLQYLYMYLPPAMIEEDANNQVVNLGNGLEHADNLTRLENFGVSGVTGYFENTYSNLDVLNDDVKSKLSSITNFEKISSTIKDKIKYMYLDHTSISSIDVLSDFLKIDTLYLAGCRNLTSLTGMENHSNFMYLKACSCAFSNFDGVSGTSLKMLYAQGNTNLTSLSGLNSCDGLWYIYVAGCSITDLSALRNKQSIKQIILSNNATLEDISVISTLNGLELLYLNQITTLNEVQVKSVLADSGIAAKLGKRFLIDGKYAKYFATVSSRIDLSYDYLGYYIDNSNSEWINIKNRTSVTELSLKSQTSLNDDDLQATLKTMTGLEYLSLAGTNIKSLNFLKSVKYLKELDVRGCKFNVDEESGMANLSELNYACSKMHTFVIDDSNVDLSLLETGINCVMTNAVNPPSLNNSWISVYAYECIGFITCNATFNWDDTTNITKYYARRWLFPGSNDYTVDLSNNLSLTYVYYNYGDKVILPPNLTDYSITGGYFDLSNCASITKLQATPKAAYNGGDFVESVIASVNSATQWTYIRMRKVPFY